MNTALVSVARISQKKRRNNVSCITMSENEIPAWITAQIVRIIRNGGTAEVKKEHGQYVVVEVKRKVHRN